MTAEQQEKEYLEVIKERLLFAVGRVDDTVKQFSEEYRKNQQYNYDNQSGMDEADLVAAGQSINRMNFTNESTIARKKKLVKLADSPYFGRIDFAKKTGEDPAKIYIGIYSFADPSSGTNFIYDWRAPISSMFYDFELGEGWYLTPAGRVTGEILLKRQYKIREGRMEYMIENSVNVHDDILQKELSKSTDDKMKNIVATIQRDQNAVIRNETASVMIIQGVAGSGKTSIALHRIAFLLYRFREDISAKDILILSPNKVFADYISNVLPELGEEQIPEMVMEELATDVLEDKLKFQTFFQQVSLLLEKPEPAYVERIRFKSSFEFLSKLNKYLVHVENNYFEAEGFRIAGTVVTTDFILTRFKTYHRMPMLKRFPEVVKDVLQHIRTTTQRKLSGREKAQVWEAVPRMFKMSNSLDLYRGFFDWIGRSDLFTLTNGGVLEYADVFPLIYCKIRLEGVQAYDHVKHLLVDEMQDYTPVQYAVISRMFRCKKTILGDVSQTVNPYSASSAETIQEVFPQADTVRLLRSYRSTFEITRFAQRINSNPELIAMERHGPEPTVVGFDSNAEEIESIRKLITDFKSSGHQSLGILCKTFKQAEFLNRELKLPGIQLLSADSTTYREGIIITTVHLAKGLEFDEVIVAFCSASNYQTDVDRSMLYIACTRAMHRLSCTYTKEMSKFIA